jgi:3',5'-cyclic AMP phosphodiesterase CpdA
LLNDPVIRRHRVVAHELIPDTRYEYSLGDGSPQGWTPWYRVRTAPDEARSFSFLYMGDPQCGLEDWGKLLASARRRHPDAAFLLIAGDLVDRGNERTNWDHFFLRAAGVFETLPLMSCVGNHEYLDQGPRLYRAFFELPANGPDGIDSKLVYSFQYGNAFVAVLDSTLALSDPVLAAKQAAWLDDSLSRTASLWKIVMFHHPVYASHPTRESPPLGAAWIPIFDRHRVDLVLQGHDHAYLRTHPLAAGARTPRAEDGTTYVVSVSGTKYYGQRRRAETAVGFTGVSTYQSITIQVPGNRLTYRAWDGDGRAVDGFTIEKTGAAERVAARGAAR